MKTIHICSTCGSPRVFADAWAALNGDEVRTYDATHCDDCEGPRHTRQVSVPDDFDLELDIYDLLPPKPAPLLSPLEQLKAAFTGTTPGEWITTQSPSEYYVCQLGDDTFVDTTDRDIVMGETVLADAQFIALAHKLMPLFLAVVDALDYVLDGDRRGDLSDLQPVRDALENLK